MNKPDLLKAIKNHPQLSPEQKAWWIEKIPNLSQGLQEFLMEVLSIQTKEDQEKMQQKLSSMQSDLKNSWQKLQNELANLYQKVENESQNAEFQSFLKQNDL